MALWRDIAAYFEVVVDKGRRVCGAKIFFEREFTLAARACIAALGKVEKRRENIEIDRLCSDQMGREVIYRRPAARIAPAT